MTLSRTAFRARRALTSRFSYLLILLLFRALPVQADNTPQPLPFNQDWTNISLINADDNWSGVPGIVGFRGDGLASATGVNPQTVLGESTVIDVNANQTNPNTFITGGVAEFHIPNPVVALQGSGTARAPYLQFHINTTGQSNITVSYNLRDVDGSADNAIQPVALQFRVGSTGNFTNVPAAFVADATTGPNLATLVTPVSVTLPVAVENQPLVQIRIITTDAAGSDEWVGIDDISITAATSSTNPSGAGAANPNSVAIGNSTLLSVSVTPGTNPASTGLAVTADLTPIIAGVNSQQFYDDGTHGDVTAGDHVFSFNATVANGTTGGAKSIAARITDAQARSGTANISLTVLAPISPSGTGSADPNSLQVGDTSLLTVNVTPGANPPSTGITVNADLSTIGGSSAQSFSGSGNTFTFFATIASGTSPGPKTLPATISDAQGRTGNASINLTVEQPPPPIDHVVISQVYGGGGNSGATYRNDYVELFNPGTVPFDLAGWTLQYASAAGSAWGGTSQPLGGVIAPGQYFLISLASGGAVGAELPAANISGEINMSATAGKIALVSNGEPLSGPCPLGDADLVDLVGYGTTATCREGTTNAPALSNTTALFRRNGGLLDTNRNDTDFVIGTPSPRRTAPITEIGPAVVNTDPISNAANAPRDSSITINFTEPVDAVGAWYDISCASTGVHNDATVASSSSARTYVITPNTNFLAGEQCSVTIRKDFIHDQDLDDSTPNTDTLAANYSFTFTIATGTLPPYPPEVHLTMGNPSGAIADTRSPNNYLMMKPELALSYNRDRGTPNWVSWHLSDEWIGTLTRVDTFRPDPAVPADWYRVQATDYFGTGFDRGHMTPNADRDKETSIPINQATFLMTNMLPQAPDNNQGSWANFENYLRTLLPAYEIYIVAGGAGTGGTGSAGAATTIANGHVTVPAQIWKVALVLEKGDGDVARVNAATRTIAVIMPNVQLPRTSDPNDWQNYLATVDQVEALTGYDFFANVEDAVENAIEAGRNGVNPPGVANQAVSTNEDEAKTFTLNAVTPTANALTYTISNPAHGTVTGSGSSRTYTPAPDFNGTDTFTVRVNDGARDSNTATVTITIFEVNDAPVTADDTASTNEDQTLSIAASALKANDATGPADESAQTLSVTSVTATPDTHGSVSLASGTVTYVPDINFNGVATFTYQVCDNGITRGVSDPQCSIGTVHVTVNAVNDSPTLAPIADQTVLLGDTLTFTAAGSDIDVPAQTLTYSLDGAVPAGAAIAPDSGVFTWLPSGTDAGLSFTFNVVVSDGSASAFTPVTIHVVDNGAPDLSTLSLSLNQLWPANHKMVDITVTYTVSDAGDPSPACSLRVTSNEPVDGTGSGDTAPDWQVIDPHHVRLRAERAAIGNGRKYTIYADCADRFGNGVTGTAIVTVPKSLGN